MSGTTQRLRYFDGEFLRSGDFTDEQSYHVDMRRLLNHELHLSGIVTGLRIVEDQNSVPPTALFYSVAPGFAIDQIGREIYVSAPASLTPLLSRAGVQSGPCELWIVYTETASGSPASGYQLCNEPSQNTRWTESFDLVLRYLSGPPDPNVPDPNRDLKGVCLGVLSVNADPSGGWFFWAPSDWYRRRHYAKIRAQSIVAPDDVKEDSFVFLTPALSPQVFPPPPHGYVHIETPNGVYSDGSILVQGNALIGDDFILDSTVDPGVPSSLPVANGNLKVAGDLFLQGELYGASSGSWLSLDAYIKSLIPAAPDIHFTGSYPIKVTGISSPSLPTNPALVPSPPSNIKFSNVAATAYVTGYEFVDGTDFQSAMSADAGADFYSMDLNVVGVAPGSGNVGDTVNLSITCSIGGNSANKSIFNNIYVAAIVVFYP